MYVTWWHSPSNTWQAGYRRLTGHVVETVQGVKAMSLKHIATTAAAVVVGMIVYDKWVKGKV